MDKSSPLFTASTLSLCWDYSNLNFAEYITWAAELIKKNRCDLITKNEQTIINANLPFELRPESPEPPGRGILLIHGILSCPLYMRDIANLLQKKGFLVRSVLLPGHGTKPGDLRTTSVEDWQKTVDFGIKSLQQEVKEVWLGGLSGGADLALDAAYQHSIQGLLLFAPSFKLKNPLAPLIPLFNYANKKFHFDYWPEIDAEHDYAKYESFPIHLAKQAYQLTKIIQKKLAKQEMPAPVWMALTEDDETICSQTAKKLLFAAGHNTDKLVWYSKEARLKNTKHIHYRYSQFASQDILDLSHACLTISPANFHYGINGDYLAPLNRPTKPIMDMNEYYGALTNYNLKNFNIRRILFNPDFDWLMQEMSQFIDAQIRVY